MSILESQIDRDGSRLKLLSEVTQIFIFRSIEIARAGSQLTGKRLKDKRPREWLVLGKGKANSVSVLNEVINYVIRTYLTVC